MIMHAARSHDKQNLINYIFLFITIDKISKEYMRKIIQIHFLCKSNFLKKWYNATFYLERSWHTSHEALEQVRSSPHDHTIKVEFHSHVTKEDYIINIQEGFLWTW